MGGKNSKCNTSLTTTNASISSIQSQLAAAPATCEANLTKITAENNTLQTQINSTKNPPSCNNLINTQQKNAYLKSKINTSGVVCTNNTNLTTNQLNQAKNTTTTYTNASNSTSTNMSTSAASYSAIILTLQNKIAAVKQQYTNLAAVVPASIVATAETAAAATIAAAAASSTAASSTAASSTTAGSTTAAAASSTTAAAAGSTAAKSTFISYQYPIKRFKPNSFSKVTFVSSSTPSASTSSSTPSASTPSSTTSSTSSSTPSASTTSLNIPSSSTTSSSTLSLIPSSTASSSTASSSTPSSSTASSSTASSSTASSSISPLTTNNNLTACNTSYQANLTTISTLNSEIASNTLTTQPAPITCTEIVAGLTNSYNTSSTNLNNEITTAANNNSASLGVYQSISNTVNANINSNNTAIKQITSLNASISSNKTQLSTINTTLNNNILINQNLLKEINNTNILYNNISSAYTALNNQSIAVLDQITNLSGYTTQIGDLISIATIILNIQNQALIPLNTLVSSSGSMGLEQIQLVGLYSTVNLYSGIKAPYIEWCAIMMARIVLMAMCVANIYNQLYIANTNLVSCVTALNTIITSGGVTSDITTAINYLTTALNALNNISGTPVAIAYPGDNGSVTGDTYCTGAWGNPSGSYKNMNCVSGVDATTNASVACNISQSNVDWTFNCIYPSNLYTISNKYTSLLSVADGPNAAQVEIVGTPQGTPPFTATQSSATILTSMNTTVSGIITSLNTIKTNLTGMQFTSLSGGSTLESSSLTNFSTASISNAIQYIGDNGAVDGNVYCMGHWGNGSINKLMGCLYGENSAGNQISCSTNDTSASYYCLPNSGSYTYIGAYNDSGTSRAIPTQYTSVNSTSPITSVTQAINIALSLGATVFGIQSGGASFFYNTSTGITTALTSATQYGASSTCTNVLGCTSVNQVYVISSYYTGSGTTPPLGETTTASTATTTRSTFVSSNLYPQQRQPMQRQLMQQMQRQPIQQMQRPQYSQRIPLITNLSPSMGETFKNHFRGV
jgi:hypothetical protein